MFFSAMAGFDSMESSSQLVTRKPIKKAVGINEKKINNPLATTDIQKE